MKLTLTVDIDEADLADFVRLVASHLAECGQVPSRGKNPPPAPGRNRPPDPDRPIDGRTLLGWASKRGLKSAVVAYGVEHGHPSKVVSWTEKQAGDAYDAPVELARHDAHKPAKGSQDWGQVARSGRVSGR